MNKQAGEHEGPRPLLPTWASSLVTGLAVVAVGALIWSLVEQNKLLKEGGSSRVAPEPVSSLDRGDRLEDVGLESLAGDKKALASVLNGGGLLAVFTTTCPYCEATLPFWSELAKEVTQRGWSFVPVSLHDAERTRAYLSSRELGWSTWTPGSPDDRQALNVKLVPTTALVDRSGEVIAAWRGALDEHLVEEILTQLDELGARKNTETSNPGS